MKRKIFIIVLFLNNFLIVKAQLQDRIWVFGQPSSSTTNAVFNFSDILNPIFSIPEGQPTQIANNDGMEQWGVVTNPNTGALIFYTDGRRVFNSFHQLVDIEPGIAGYELLGANISSTQPVAISVLPKPPYEQYIIFSNPTGSIDGSVYTGPITYRIYNSYLNSFSGIQSLPGPYSSNIVTEGMKIIPCPTNPNKIWLITSLFPSTGMLNRYVVYKIQFNVITYEGYYDFGPTKLLLSGVASPLLNIKYSNTSIDSITNVGFVLQHTSRVFVIQFNNKSGEFLTSTYKEYNPGYSSIPSIYDLEFSPNGRFVYYAVYYTSATNNQLFQLDLQDNILVSTLVKTFPARYAGGLKRGPDGLIYHVNDAGYNGSLQIGRILQPDLKFITNITNLNSFYQDNFHSYPGLKSWAFCETILFPNLNVSNKDVEEEKLQINIYPNPVNKILNISFFDFRDHLQIFICNSQGSIVNKVSYYQNEKIDVSKLSSGMYFLLIKEEGVLIKMLKFIKI